jgi:hypothetical protein
MLCAHCRAELPDGAILCWSCGRQIVSGVGATAAADQTCEIKFSQASSFTTAEGYFFAEAYGPAGAQTIAFSPRFAPPYREENPAALAALNALSAQLAQEGWQRVDAAGEQWYSRRFRRRPG